MFAAEQPGSVIVTRSTSLVRRAATTRRSRSSSAGAFGNSDAACPCGPLGARAPDARPSSSLVVFAPRPPPRRARPSSGAPWAALSIRSSSLSFTREVVRALVVGRHAALIAPPEPSPCSSGSVEPRGQLVRGPGRVAARPARDLPGAGGLHEQLGCGAPRLLAVCRKFEDRCSGPPFGQLFRALHGRPDRVQESGTHACALELADRPNRRSLPATSPSRAASTGCISSSRRSFAVPEHRLDDELGPDFAREPEARSRPRSSPPPGARSTRGRSPRRQSPRPCTAREPWTTPGRRGSAPPRPSPGGRCSHARRRTSPAMPSCEPVAGVFGIARSTFGARSASSGAASRHQSTVCSWTLRARRPRRTPRRSPAA